MAKDTFYFSHDYNARNDAKIKKLLSRHGYLGYGIFWAIIEDLYNNANALPLDSESIAFDLRTTQNVVDSIINDFDLFVIEDNFFGSHSVQRRLEERDAKSIKARESAFKRWSKENKDANALPPQSDCNAIKERKGNEIIDTIVSEEMSSKELGLIISKEHTNYEAIRLIWNKFAEKTNKPKVSSISQERKAKLKTRFKNKDFNIYNILIEATKQDYLLENTFFSFDWMIDNNNNFVKVLEGNYKSRETKKTNDAPKFKI